jgi:hypothetical protein
MSAFIPITQVLSVINTVIPKTFVPRTILSIIGYPVYAGLTVMTQEFQYGIPGQLYTKSY